MVQSETDKIITLTVCEFCRAVNPFVRRMPTLTHTHNHLFTHKPCITTKGSHTFLFTAAALSFLLHNVCTRTALQYIEMSRIESSRVISTTTGLNAPAIDAHIHIHTHMTYVVSGLICMKCGFFKLCALFYSLTCLLLLLLFIFDFYTCVDETHFIIHIHYMNVMTWKWLSIARQKKSKGIFARFGRATFPKNCQKRVVSFIELYCWLRPGREISVHSHVQCTQT